MATITDHNGEERDFVVVLVEDGGHRVVGVAHVLDLFSCPDGPILLEEPGTSSCNVHPYRTGLILHPDTIEALREQFRSKPTVADVEELQRQIVNIKVSTRPDKRFENTDRIPVPKGYQRNRFKR